MKRAVIVTGLCRSGSAAVAEVCHVLGYPMGRTFMAPIAPDFRFDYEDADFTAAMVANVERGLPPLQDFSISWLVQDRVSHAHAFNSGERLGFKSPLLSLADAMPCLYQELRSEGFDVIRIGVLRQPEAIERSIARQPGADVLRRWNRMIEVNHTITVYDFAVSYEALVADPAAQVAALAARLGVDDAVAIRQAAARVAQPLS